LASIPESDTIWGMVVEGGVEAARLMAFGGAMEP
jgi:hypothetical protein